MLVRLVKKLLNPRRKRLSLAQRNLNDINNINRHKKVFIIGMSKTGTSSMESLLEVLGYRVCKGHWNNKDTNYLCACYVYNDINEILNITNYYDAFADAPWGGTELYKKLVQLYPDAYYILTIRDAAAWYKSYIKMYEQFDKKMSTALETMRSFGAYGNYIFFRKIFGIDNIDNNGDKITNYYNNYNNNVRRFFQDTKYNFIELDVTASDFDVTTLYKFLGKTSAINKMPHVNKGVY